MTQTRHVGRLFMAVVAMGLALLVAGCGGDSEDNGTSDMKAVAKVMSDLNTASRAGDGERICSQLFTPKLANSVSTSSSSGECAREVKAKLFSPEAKISVENIAVPDEANASATVKEANGNTSTVFLVKQDGQWRIRSVAPA
jgi:hypothetical protein